MASQNPLKSYFLVIPAKAGIQPFQYLPQPLDPGCSQCDDLLRGHQFSIWAGSSDSALPWLYGIAANLVRRHRRTEVRRLKAYARTGVDESVELDEPGVAERLDAGALGASLASALASLTADERETVSLVVFAELTYEEVGQALGIPTGTVASRMNRIRARLAAHLPEESEVRREETS
jgi:RNA polymerase sigma factor (sigma-70 family)